MTKGSILFSNFPTSNNAILFIYSALFLYTSHSCLARFSYSKAYSYSFLYFWAFSAIFLNFFCFSFIFRSLDLRYSFCSLRFLFSSSLISAIFLWIRIWSSNCRLDLAVLKIALALLDLHYRWLTSKEIHHDSSSTFLLYSPKTFISSYEFMLDWVQVIWL